MEGTHNVTNEATINHCVLQLNLPAIMAPKPEMAC